MTDPYASIAETYDIMIDWPARLAREQPFFTELFAQRGVRRVLDVGCGTGHHSRLFAEMGVQVVGIDPSLPMLERARALSGDDSASTLPSNGGSPLFLRGGLDDIRQQSGKFDLIVILGNTLAYVKNPKELRNVLRDAHKMLTGRGQLIIQLVNYQKILATGDYWLPVLERQAHGQSYMFLREYRQRKKHIEFSLFALRRDTEWRVQVERSRHFPIGSDLLTHALFHTQFLHIDFYADYQRAPYLPEASDSLIAVAGKRDG